MLTLMYALVFGCSGFLAGCLMQRPYAAVRVRMGNDLRGQAARIAVYHLLDSPVDEFIQRYLLALSLSMKWIFARVVLLSCQLGMALVCYFCIAISFDAHEPSGNWIFSLSAMLGASNLLGQKIE